MDIFKINAKTVKLTALIYTLCFFVFCFFNLWHCTVQHWHPLSEHCGVMVGTVMCLALGRVAFLNADCFSLASSFSALVRAAWRAGYWYYAASTSLFYLLSAIFSPPEQQLIPPSLNMSRYLWRRCVFTVVLLTEITDHDILFLGEYGACVCVMGCVF